MPQKKTNIWDTPEGKLGRAGEDLIRKWLKDEGYFVVPAGYIENGGAPMLEGWIRSHVLPDLMSFKNSKGTWVEVKTKTRPTFNRNRNRMEHGIPARHWRDYLQVELETGITGALAVLEAGVGHILLADLSGIKPSAVIMDGTGTIKAYGEPMVFFNNDSFTRIVLDGDKYVMPETIPPVIIRDWEQQERQLGLFE